jgi:hypothetical protein
MIFIIYVHFGVKCCQLSEVLSKTSYYIFFSEKTKRYKGTPRDTNNPICKEKKESKKEFRRLIRVELAKQGDEEKELIMGGQVLPVV